MSEKNPYQVMFIKDNKIILHSNWVMAESAKIAERVAIAENATLYTEEVRVLCRPFCE